MEEVKVTQVQKICQNCLKYKAFYIRDNIGFVQQDLGCCTLSDTEKQHTCEKWCSNYKNLTFRKHMILYRIDDSLKALEDYIHAVKRILKEDYENPDRDLFL